MPTRTSLSLGNWLSAWVPVVSESTGIARKSRTELTAITAVQGRAMTLAVQRCQKADSAAAGRSGRRNTRCLKKESARATIPPGSTRSPSIAIRAGSNVIAVRIETATTVIAPSAIERNAWLSTIQRPARETITAMPEKVTARPEVARASARASSSLRPARRSSR